MKLKTKIILAIIAIFAIMLMINSNVQAVTTIDTIEEDSDGVVTFISKDNNEYYKLTGDVYLDLIVKEGETLKLDLNGYTFYNYSSDEYAITVEEGGTFLIVGGGKLATNPSPADGGTSAKAIIYNYGDFLCRVVGQETGDPTNIQMYYSGEAAIINEGYVDLAMEIYAEEGASGYAIYNKGVMDAENGLVGYCEQDYGLLVNEGTMGSSFGIEVYPVSSKADDVPMIINCEGASTNGICGVLNIHLSSSDTYYSGVCNRTIIENAGDVEMTMTLDEDTEGTIVLVTSWTAETEVSYYGNVELSDNLTLIAYKVADSETNIVFEADNEVIEDGTVLVTAELTSGTMYDTATKALKDIVSTIKVYDITLKLNGEAVEPEGNVKIYIPIPEGMDVDNLVAYRIDEDGTKTEYKVTVDGDYAVIETNHFSTYVLAELASTTTTTTKTENDTKTTTTTETSTTTTEATTTETSTTTTTDTTDTTTDELDETPKTGANEISAQISMLVALISIASLAIIKKR